MAKAMRTVGCMVDGKVVLRLVVVGVGFAWKWGLVVVDMSGVSGVFDGCWLLVAE